MDLAAGGRLEGSIEHLGRSYRAGSLDPVSVVREYLKRIGETNPSVNYYITVLGDSALSAAEESKRRLRSGTPIGPLDGVPIAIKDIIYIEGVNCTAGSKVLAHNRAPYDAPVVKKLKAAGAVLLGTTNLHEFAAGTTSVNPHYGAVRNPWDLNRVAGGSSGGSAAAVAADLAVSALGTDTAGSVRIPAALCGVLGLKPTYGRVSRLGVIPLSTSLDTVGVLASSAYDAATILQVISGHDREDMTTSEAEVPDFIGEVRKKWRPMRVGIPWDFFKDNVDPGVEECFRGFISRLEELGCSVEAAELDGISEVYDRWLPIRRAEATAFHLRWLQSDPDKYGDDVRRQLELGKEVLAVDYVNAVNARPSYIERFLESMKGFDAMALPTTSVGATGLAQTTVGVRGKETTVYSALNRLTLPFNYVGFPAISIPAGAAGGLPIGVQLVARLFDEASILRLAAAYDWRYGPYPRPPELGRTPTTG